MLLGLDTCGVTGTVALARREGEGEGLALVAQTELAGKTYSAQLIPRMRELLEEHGASFGEIEAIVVTNGPGSFTGVRIGLSSAKGLAEALGAPVVAVSRLAALAEKGKARAAALDAGRGEIYFGTYGEEVFEGLLSPEDVRARISEPLAVCEEGIAATFAEARLVDPPTAWDAIQFAAARLRAGDFDDVESLDANYLRRSDAEIFAKPAAAPAGRA